MMRTANNALKRMWRLRKAGSALGLSLVTMVVAILIGMAILLSAHQGALLNAGMTAAGNHYYAAESGANLAMQMFLKELAKFEESEEIKIELYRSNDDVMGLFNIETDLHAPYKTAVTLQLENQYKEIFKEVKDNFVGKVFNGETVTLGGNIRIEVSTSVKVGTVSDIVAGVPQPPRTWAVAYLSGYSVVLESNSGGRTVLSVLGEKWDVEIDATGDVTTRAKGTGGGGGSLIENFTRYNGGILDRNGDSGGRSNSGGEVTFDEFEAALKVLLDSAEELAEVGPGGCDDVACCLPLPCCVGGKCCNNEECCADDECCNGVECSRAFNYVVPCVEKKRANPELYPDFYVHEGDLIITKTNEGTYAGYRYIYVRGTLSFSGGTAVNPINLPNLKGIYVAGSLLTTADNTSVSFNKEKLKSATDPEDGSNNTGPLIGTHIVIGSPVSNAQINIGRMNTINNSIFYTSGRITINAANGDAFTIKGNGVFVSYGSAPPSMTSPDVPVGINLASAFNSLKIGDDTKAPQFYSRTEIRTNLQGGQAALRGLYASLTRIRSTGNSSTQGVFGFMFSPEIVNFAAGWDCKELDEEAVGNLIGIGSGSTLGDSFFDLVTRGKLDVGTESKRALDIREVP